MCSILSGDLAFLSGYKAIIKGIFSLFSSLFFSVTDHHSFFFFFVPSSSSGDDSETSSGYRGGPLYNSPKRAQPASQSWQQLGSCWHDGSKLFHRVRGGTNSQSGWANTPGNNSGLLSWEKEKMFICCCPFRDDSRGGGQLAFYFSCGKFRDSDLRAWSK